MRELNGAALSLPQTSLASLLDAETPPGAVGSFADRLRTKLSFAAPICTSLTALAFCTWASYRLGQSFAFTGFLDLVLVVLTALYGGFWQATAISIAAVATLNYYFIPPIFSFENTPANWVALGAFEFTAVVISRLSLRANWRAIEAIAKQREMERLYETSRRILLLDSSAEPGNHIARLIREIYQLTSVQVFDAPSGVTYRFGESVPGAEQHLLNTYLQSADSFNSGTRSWYCVMRLGARVVGGLALHGTPMSKPAATALASLSGIGFERARAMQRESHAQAARQTEQLRTAVLDALAHQFKTPLTIARTASSGLLAVGGLSDLQIELITVIDQQASKLEHLASRLLTAARLDGTEFMPCTEPVFFSQLASAAIQGLDQEADRRRFQISVSNGEIPISADRELILTSLAQLVDNAVKYSEPGSPIIVTINANGRNVVAAVRTKGLVVTPSECKRIFERFYRAPETCHVPAGTGLGLSIVKKIVEAHHGSVWAEGQAGYGTAFSISLPAARAT
jgi:two-component system sensor histidine kinase KdpD